VNLPNCVSVLWTFSNLGKAPLDIYIENAYLALAIMSSTTNSQVSANGLWRSNNIIPPAIGGTCLATGAVGGQSLVSSSFHCHYVCF